jgi:hypothetical protein
MTSIPVSRHLPNRIESQHQPSECPDSSITCYEYQRCLDCPQKFISKTRSRLIAKVNTSSKVLSPA